MTTSVRVVCTGNTEGDEVTVFAGWSKPCQVPEDGGERLQRGEVSSQLTAGPRPGHDLWLRIEGKHGDGRPAAPLDVFCGPTELPDDARPVVAYGVPIGSFGWALEMLKQGRRVRRRGWNGTGMWVWHSVAANPAGAPLDPPVKPYLVMHTATGEEQPGWLASQPCMLEDDWELAE